VSAAVGAAFGAWLAIALVYRALALRSVDHALRGAPGSGHDAPPPGEVVLVRPLRGAGAGLEPCLESLFGAAGASGVRVRAGLAHASDPAAAVFARAADRHPSVSAELRVGHGPAGVNRKLANLAQATADLEAEVLVLSDADVRLPRDFVPRMVRAFKDGDVGLVTCLYHSVPATRVPAARASMTGLVSLVSRLDALITNTHFVPGVCAALRLEGLHFALGASIAVRREALAAAGGFEALLESAADDFLLARNVERAGWRLAFEPLVVEHLLEAEGARAALRRHLRWARVARSVRPGGYAGQIVTHGAAPALGLALASLLGVGPALGGVAPLAWWLLQVPSLWRRRTALGLDARDLALVPLADLAALAIWAGGLVGRARPS
jgi:ceramide glucosyltransferase